MAHILHLGLLCFCILPILPSWAVRLPCDNTKLCSCLHQGKEKNEYWCGDTKTGIVVEVIPDTSVRVICRGLNDSSYLDMLEGIKNTPNISRFSLKQCGVPDKPLDEILAKMNIELIQELCIHSRPPSAVGFKQWHLQNLGYLETLRLTSNKITELPENIFKDLVNLKKLFLNDNNLRTLPIKIFQSLGKLERLDLGKNQLSTLDGKVFQYLSNLKRLNLYMNDIDTVSKSLFAYATKIIDLDLSSNNMTRLKNGVFDYLSNLEDLNLNYNNLTSIPDKLFVNNGKLKRITMLAVISSKNSTLPDALFAHLTELESLRVETNNLASLPKDLLRECANLNLFSLRRNSLKTLPSTLFKDTKNLEILDLAENDLESLDEALFNPLRKLKKLTLERNQLTNIPSNLFSHMDSLNNLDLSRNKLVDFEYNTFDSLKNAVKIDMGYNKLTMDRWKLLAASPFNKCVKLESLNLTNNLLDMVFDDWHIAMDKLKTLDLSFNAFENLTTQDFSFVSKNYPVTVNFSNNRIKKIDLYSIETVVDTLCDSFPCKEAFLQGRGSIDFKLENNPIHCDCDAFHLARYFQNKMSPVINQYIRLSPHGVYCHEPNTLKNISLQEVDLMELKCPLSEASTKLDKNCPDNCSCFFRPEGNTIMVDCTAIDTDKFPELVPASHEFNVELLFGGNRLRSLDGLSNLLKMANVTRLSLSSNKLKSIDDVVLPRGLKILELDNNEISSLSNRTITQLTSCENLTMITLHKNPWNCDCDAKHLKNFIRNQYRKISNKEDIRCKENGRSIISLTEEDLCYISFTVILTFISLGIFGLMSGAAVALYYIYQHEIKVWMFAHKVCLWLVAEKELDKDKIYDAFVSFSHKDQEFVDKHLIPQLEKSNDHNYKLCIHYRDFIVGEFIPSQIVHSVENSRRTIIVLTPNFLESIWARMEFRTAHLKAIKEGCARVIIVMLEDVSNEKLDPELKAYITMNTYVKWGDPLFWEKLRYALPHPQAYTKQRTSNVAPLSEAELRKQKLFNLEEVIRSKA